MLENVSKFDAALATVMANAADHGDMPISVFVRTSTPLEPTQVEALTKAGVRVPSADRSLFTATLTGQAILRLQILPWVTRLSLAPQLRQLSGASFITVPPSMPGCSSG